ncbi:MAG TPA: hypothetical protein VG710_04180 [Opitutus sp.]|nr:hypothetical protein [Opitutus sp.]
MNPSIAAIDEVPASAGTWLAKWLATIGGLMLVLAGLSAASVHALRISAPGYRLGLAFAPPWLAVSGGGCLAVATTLLLLRHASRKLATTLANAAAIRPAGFGAGVGIVLGCALLVLAFDGAAFFHGFFRLDDFEILRIARTEPLIRQLFRANADHSMLLFRLEVTVTLKLFGATPAVFNIANFLGCAGMLAAGCWLLGETGARVLSLLAFAVVAWAWPGWGDYTEGYDTLSTYVQATMFGFASVAALLRAARTGQRRWLVFCTLAAVATGLVDLAGIWIFPALAAFAWATRQTGTARSDFTHGAILCAGLAVFVVVGVNWITFGTGGFQRVEAGTLTVAGAFVAILSGTGGALLSLVLPFPAGSLHTSNLVRLIELAALASAGWIVGRQFRRQSAPDRRLVAAIAATVVVTVAMVALARPGTESGLFWPPKWTAATHAWLAVGVAFCVDRLANLGHHANSVALVLALMMWSSVTASHAAVATHAPTGRLHARHRAETRRAEFDRLVAAVAALAARIPQTPLVLPPAPRNRLFAEFPALENYPLADLLAAAPPGTPAVRVQPGPLPPEVAAALPAVPSLARVYQSAR